LLDKVEDISNVFKEYRALSFILLIVAHALIGVLLFLRYGRKFIFVLLPPALAGLGALSILGLFEYPINLFNILALFLVLGVGIDYSIFYAEDKKNSGATALAVLIATITTLLSFGLLAFSSFAVLHSFGITILLGILFSYLLAPIGTLANR
jgi:predicted exporter